MPRETLFRAIFRNEVLGMIVVVQSAAIMVLWLQLDELKGANDSAGAIAAEPVVVQSNEQGVTEEAIVEIKADEAIALTDHDHIRGNPDARIVLIEYSDYECPFCQRFHSTLMQAVDEHEGNVSWVYRHFPLTIHRGAKQKSEASECVAEVGGNEAFWQFTDILFEEQAINTSQLPSLVEEIGIEAETFIVCYNQHQYAGRVEQSISGGLAVGVAGTPSTIVYDRTTGKSQLVTGAVLYPQLKFVINQFLEAK